MTIIKSKREIEIMSEAGRIVAEYHAMLEEIIKPGVTTLELGRLVEKKILLNGIGKEL